MIWAFTFPFSINLYLLHYTISPIDLPSLHPFCSLSHTLTSSQPSTYFCHHPPPDAILWHASPTSGPSAYHLSFNGSHYHLFCQIPTLVAFVYLLITSNLCLELHLPSLSPSDSNRILFPLSTSTYHPPTSESLLLTTPISPSWFFCPSSFTPPWSNCCPPVPVLTLHLSFIFHRCCLTHFFQQFVFSSLRENCKVG